MPEAVPPRVRIAPSPTGDPHIGTAYIALFNYVFAKQNGGQFIVRIEDTDQTRYRKDSEGMILDALKWFGIKWDEGPDIGGPYGPYKQSERLPYYKEHAEMLVASGHAYRCFCTTERLAKLREQQAAAKLPPGYDRHCRALKPEEAQAKVRDGLSHVVRFKVPLTGVTEFHDVPRGNVTFENTKLDDLVLLKADGFPTYHLASVVDDKLMKITHVIRGEEWVSSTPKHVLLYGAFGWQAPTFIHLNLLRNPDKSKISKRKNPTSILYYRRKGILPEALRNFLALMGWNPGDDREVFSTEDMMQKFSWERFNLGGPVFDINKLVWMNGQYLKQLPDAGWLDILRRDFFSDDYLLRIIPLVKEKVAAFEDFFPSSATFFGGDYTYEGAPLVPKGRTPKETAGWISDVLDRLEAIESWSVEPIKAVIESYLNEKALKTKELYMALRVAVSGGPISPPLFETFEVLGKEMSRRRMRLAIEHLKKMKDAPPAP
jgi:glutamyl-tRNA synthetase